MSTTLSESSNERRTFAIISHPDAGKTTLTEKAAAVRRRHPARRHGQGAQERAPRHFGLDGSREAARHFGDQLGDAVRVPGHTINLLDTPGHEDFSEDTYRVLTAVDAAVMVIDAAKGVEAQTIKLLNVCRMRNTPIITFVNKMDREVREPFELLEEIESVLEDRVRADHLADRHGQDFSRRLSPAQRPPAALSPPARKARSESSGSTAWTTRCSTRSSRRGRQAARGCRADPGRQQPFRPRRFSRRPAVAGVLRLGINNFGVQEILQALLDWAPPPQERDGGDAHGATRRSPPSAASCSRSRPTWTRSTATASPSSASARAATRRA
jgi:peptide chain release factor 3